MAIPFLSREDTNQRLNGTICMLRDRPVIVRTGLHPNYKLLQCVPLRAAPDEGELVNIENKDFCYKSPRLGYLYFNGKAHYVMRKPMRDVKEGLSINSLYVDPWVDPRNFFQSAAMEKCILGKHYKMPDALRMLAQGKCSSVPVHRHVAIGKFDDKIVMYYRLRKIAEYNDETKLWQLDASREYSFLLRILGKLQIGVQ